VDDSRNARQTSPGQAKVGTAAWHCGDWQLPGAVHFLWKTVLKVIYAMSGPYAQAEACGKIWLGIV